MAFVKLPLSKKIVNLDRIAYITGIMNINAYQKDLAPVFRYDVIFFNYNSMGSRNIYIEEEDYQFIVSKLTMIE